MPKLTNMEKQSSTIDADTIKSLIGRILQYGYTGNIDPTWVSQNSAAADKLAHVYATQLLIWETIVGERDEQFAHVQSRCQWARWGW